MAQASLKPKLVPVFQATAPDEEKFSHPANSSGRFTSLRALKVSHMAPGDSGNEEPGVKERDWACARSAERLGAEERDWVGGKEEPGVMVAGVNCCDK